MPSEPAMLARVTNPTTEPVAESDQGHAFLMEALERYERPIIRFALGYVGNLDQARDVAQDVFIKLSQNLNSLDRERLAPWLFTVCKNRALDYQRKNQRLIPMELETLNNESSDAARPSDAIEERELHHQLKGWIAELPEKQREAVRLKFEGGLSYKEISETLKTSVGNVGSLIHLGVNQLRERWLSMNA